MSRSRGERLFRGRSLVFEFLEDRTLLHAELASLASEPELASVGRDAVAHSDAASPGTFAAARSSIGAGRPFDASGDRLETSGLQIDFGDAPDLPAGSLTTTMAGDSRADGLMFDITALEAVTITRFDVNLRSTADIAIHFKAGSHVGFETDRTAWTMAGRAEQVIAMPQGTPTPIPISLDVTIPAGQTFAFYVTTASGPELLSLPGTAVGNVFAADSNIQIREGTKTSYGFNFASGRRVFNGVVHYGGRSYATLLANDGARHAIGGPFMGALVDVEADGQSSVGAVGDDLNGSDDEDGVNQPAGVLSVVVGMAPTVDVTVTNNSGTAATLYGWIDYDRDGVFDNTTERASIGVPNGTTSGTVSLTFPVVPPGSNDTTYARFRLSTDAAAQHPTGLAADGEVEDYQVTIGSRIQGQHWLDLDGDGSRAAGEPGVNGWEVRLFDDRGELVATQTTEDVDLDNNGFIDPLTERGIYTFTGLAAGSYSVAEVLTPGWEQTSPAPGTLYFSVDRNENGLYTLQPTNGLATHIGFTGVTRSNVGLAPSASPDLLYGTEYTSLLHINADGSGSLDVGGGHLHGLAYDAATNTLYGDSSGSFWTIDPATGFGIAQLAAAPQHMDGIAFGNGGVYGLSNAGHSLLYFYSASTNSWSVVGETGVVWDDPGLAYDPDLDVLYAKGEEDSFLYRIDPATGSATVIGDTGMEIGGGLAFASGIPQLSRAAGKVPQGAALDDRSGTLSSAVETSQPAAREGDGGERPPLNTVSRNEIHPGVFIERGRTVVDPQELSSGTRDSQAARLDGNGLEFQFNAASGTPQSVIDGFIEAGRLWSQALDDDILVSVDISFVDLPAGVLGAARATEIDVSYSDFKSRLTADVTSTSDTTAVASLQPGANFGMLINRTANHPESPGSDTPYVDDDGDANNRTIHVATANAKAIGGLGIAPGNTAADADISFSNSFTWDFDRSNGISSGAFDFVGVAAHEIGHALGFISGVDILDLNSPPVGGPFDDDQFPFVSPLDMYRYSADSIAAAGGPFIDWTVDTRTKSFSIDGGTTLLTTFSEGVNHGDGRQASHWKDDLDIGLLDPTFSPGELGVISPLDIEALDVIGWDVVPTVTLSVLDAALTEAGGQTTVTATLSDILSETVTVDLSFSGTATGGGTDYTASATQLVIPAGSTTGSITLTAVQDTFNEPRETIIVDVETATNVAEDGTQQVTVQIIDDDPRGQFVVLGAGEEATGIDFGNHPTLTVSLEVDQADIAEGGGTATFTTRLSAVSELPVTIDLEFTGTAGLNDDYTSSSTQIVIPAGNTTGQVTVTATQDKLAEDDETIIVDIAGVTNAALVGAQQQIVTIADDDATLTGAGVNGIGSANRSGLARLVLQFDHAVTVGDAGALEVFNHTTGAPIDISTATLTNDGSQELTWNFSGITFPDGYYTATLPAAEAEAGLGATQSVLFHVLAGDSSGNAQVDFADFGHLASFFNTVAGPVFGPGDLNGDGNVNFTDFGILAANFNDLLASPPTDFGDAPRAGTTYSTTRADNGARHILGTGLYLGTVVDAESDGQPNASATGDDNASDDEDGVTFGPLQAGTTAEVVVNATIPATAVLNAWIDFNADGDWADAGEQVFVDQALSTGVNNLTVSIPAHAAVGETYARFRVTSGGGYSYFGLAPDGEVEDYQVTLLEQPLDFGDAPETWTLFPTTLARDGARHVLGSGLYLGAGVDAELDGQPDAGALGDDNAGDDEDGVTFAALRAGQTADVTVTATVPGTAVLNAWLDFNADGDWADAGEQIFVNQVLNNGVNQLAVAIPSGAAVGPTFARFRVTGSGGVSYFGLAPDGEVEDYQVTVMAPSLDFGDAPEDGTSYPTTLANDGPRHILGSGLYLGGGVDAEADGQPEASAAGDDNAGDDEDGVTFATLQAGTTAGVTVTATVPGSAVLNAWLDFNADGDWEDAGEQIFVDQVLSGGANQLTAVIPSDAALGLTFARFRVTAAGGYSFTGLAPEGEVEDYQIMIFEPPSDYGDAPEAGTSYPTTRANDGARHILGSGLYLGGGVDAEIDGQPNADATGDGADEDGVTFAALETGATANITVVARVPGSGILNAWIDFNADGDWADAGEQVLVERDVIDGENNLTISIPANAFVGSTFGRFRLSRYRGSSYFGQALEGEVEDYRMTISEPMNRLPQPHLPTAAAADEIFKRWSVQRTQQEHPLDKSVQSSPAAEAAQLIGLWAERMISDEQRPRQASEDLWSSDEDDFHQLLDEAATEDESLLRALGALRRDLSCSTSETGRYEDEATDLWDSLPE